MWVPSVFLSRPSSLTGDKVNGFGLLCTPAIICWRATAPRATDPSTEQAKTNLSSVEVDSLRCLAIVIVDSN